MLHDTHKTSHLRTLFFFHQIFFQPSTNQYKQPTNVTGKGSGYGSTDGAYGPGASGSGSSKGGKGLGGVGYGSGSGSGKSGKSGGGSGSSKGGKGSSDGYGSGSGSGKSGKSSGGAYHMFAKASGGSGSSKGAKGASGYGYRRNLRGEQVEEEVVDEVEEQLEQ